MRSVGIARRRGGAPRVSRWESCRAEPSRTEAVVDLLPSFEGSRGLREVVVRPELLGIHPVTAFDLAVLLWVAEAGCTGAGCPRPGPRGGRRRNSVPLSVCTWRIGERESLVALRRGPRACPNRAQRGHIYADSSAFSRTVGGRVR